MQHFGSAAAVVEAPAEEIGQLPGFGPKIMQGWGSWRQSGAWKKELELVEKMRVKLIPWTSPEYPKRLLEIADYPVLLYVRGEIKPSDRQAIAVVGTRHPTIYGLEMAEKFGQDLAAQGFTVISGLARGVDTAAHKGALQRGRTIAVIGSGLADIYPQENMGLAEEISEKGALVSEFPMSTPPDRQNFPQRNRIVSGMSLGTLLVEAPIKSGAMITMERALTHGRKLFALPGRADSEQFRGNHCLIKQRQAQLVENAQDVAAGFEDMFQNCAKPPLMKSAMPALEKEEADLLRHMPAEEVSYEELSRLANLPVVKLNVLLMSLMLKKAIREYPGKIYKRAVLGIKDG